jgi:CheY-like chemotaxis protein
LSINHLASERRRRVFMGRKARILVAEDSAADAELFARALRPFKESKGLTADCVTDGDQALALIKKKSYDIVFLDVSMPGFTGIELLRYIKENHRKEKVIILTGYPDVGDHFCKMLGADEYREKPLGREALGEILEKYAPTGNANTKL